MDTIELEVNELEKNYDEIISENYDERELEMETKLNFKKKLWHIQTEIEVKKTRFNKHFNYHYSDLCDVLEALRPLQKKYKVLVAFNTTRINIEGKYVIKAICQIADVESEEFIEGSVEVPEDISKKQNEQTTGATITYACKYAIKNLLGINDEADPDKIAGTEVKKSNKQQPKAEAEAIGNSRLINDTEIAILNTAFHKLGLTEEQVINALNKKFKKINPNRLTKNEYHKILDDINKKWGNNDGN